MYKANLGYLRLRFQVQPPTFEEFERVLKVDASYGYIDQLSQEELLDLWKRAGKLPGNGQSYYQPKRTVIRGQKFLEWFDWANELTAVTFRHGVQRPGYEMSEGWAKSRFIMDMVDRGYSIASDDDSLSVLI